MRKKQSETQATVQPDTHTTEPTNRRKFLRNAALGVVGGGAALQQGVSIRHNCFF